MHGWTFSFFRTGAGGGIVEPFTCRLEFFVYLFVSVLAFGHVFLMKAHAGQINSQKLRCGALLAFEMGHTSPCNQ